MDKEETRREEKREEAKGCIYASNWNSLTPSLGKHVTSEGSDLDSNLKGDADRGWKEAVERQWRVLRGASKPLLCPVLSPGQILSLNHQKREEQHRTATILSVGLKTWLSGFLPSSKPRQPTSEIGWPPPNRTEFILPDCIIIVLISTGWPLLLQVTRECLQDSQAGLRTQAWWAWLGGEEATLPRTWTVGSKKTSLVGSRGANHYFSSEGFSVRERQRERERVCVYIYFHFTLS